MTPDAADAPGAPGRTPPVTAGTGPLQHRAWASNVAALLASAVVWLALLGPLGALLVHISPRAARDALSAPGALAPLVTSVEASLVALVVLVVAGTPLAWMMARERLPLPRLVEAGVLVPLLMPPLVIGLLLVFFLGPATPLGGALAHLHLSASNTFFALVVAEVYEAAPYYVLGAQSAFSSVAVELEENAALLGDPWRRTFVRVTLPLAAPGLATALATGWARAMGAFGAVIVIAYHPYGLPMQIWVTLQQSGLAAALPFALLLIIVSLPLPLLAFAWSARSRVGTLTGA